MGKLIIIMKLNFDLYINQKRCIYCNAYKNCRMTLITNYADKCNRYPQGPGFIKEDIKYQNELSTLANMLYDPNSEIHRQLKELESSVNLNFN